VKSKKNLHLEHLEDEIINEGYPGAVRAFGIVNSLLDLFEGNATKKINLTVKWDGAPAIIAGPDPETGYFFVATKSAAFGVTPRLAFSEEMIEVFYEGKGDLIETLKHAFRELKPTGMKSVLQGDILFTPSKKKPQNISGIDYITFKPNTIIYAIPTDDPLSQEISDANVGIVFHTTYSGGDTISSMSASFGAINTDALKTKTAWIQSATYTDVSGKITLLSSETITIKQMLAKAKDHATAAKILLNKIANEKEGDLTIGAMFKTFVNKQIREGAEISVKSLAKFEDHAVNIIKGKEGIVQKVETKAKYAGLRAAVQAFIRTNDASFRALFSLYSCLTQIKNIMVQKLDEAQGISAFLETEEGFKVTTPEGYVAVDHNGNAIKLISRLEFSRANFLAIKDWKPAVSQPQVDKPLKTIIFNFSRMNPPTAGHQKVISKVEDLAKTMSADSRVVISHTQDKKKNPLDPQTKLKFTRKFFPRINIDVSSPQKPTFMSVLEELSGKYEKVVIVVGSDRVAEFIEKTAKYNGKLYNFKILEVVSAGERDPDADGVTGISASKMRAFAMNNDFVNFKKGLPKTASEKDAKDLMRAVQEGME
jgi:Family of unknown function (DUF6267)